MLNAENDAAMFVTVLYAVYDPETRVLTYANGGHNPPLIVHADGSSDLLPLTGGVALGLVPELEFEQDSLTIAPGDSVVLYTDGVTEAMNGEAEEFGNERLLRIFSDGPPKSSREANTAVLNAVSDFVGETPQSDDITCLTLYLGSVGS